MEVIRVMKINVSMPDDIVRKLDEAALEANCSRSALVTMAAERYLEVEEEKKIRERRNRAVEHIREIAEKMGPWDGTAEILKWRGLL
jgi:metal-responsive CopG/Arc/MetJ family transcriptional regulator